MKKTILEIKNLVKEFKTASASRKLFSKQRPHRAVDDVCFSITEGEILGVVGESGSGKSTLALLLLHLIAPTSGQILFYGKDVSKNREDIKRFRRSAQIIFQDPYSSLNPKKTVFETLFEAMRAAEYVTKKEEADPLIDALLKEVGLPIDSKNRYPHAFSGGQRQRIAIARALAGRPEFLICDEILSALDLSIQAQILSLLFELKKKRNLTLLFISHDLATVERFCDRAIVFYRGKIVETATISNLFKNPRHPYTQLLLASKPKFDPREVKKNRDDFEVKKENTESDIGCPFFSRCPKAAPECASEFPQEKKAGPDQSYCCIH